MTGVEKGRSATLPCLAEGSPDPVIRWHKDMSPLDMTVSRYAIVQGGSLQISDAEEDDQGEYECVAENSLGTSFSNVAMLYVREPIYEVMPGAHLNITCVAVGSPMPYVKWRKGAVDMTPEHSIPIGKNVLLLDNIQESANYTCIASSKLGNIEALAQITVRVHVVPVMIIMLYSTTWNIDETEAGMLSWSYDIGSENILYYVIQYKPKQANQEYSEISGITTTYYTVRDLSPYTEYEFYVIAMNTIGRGSPSTPIVVTTGETEPGSAPRNVQARPLSSSVVVIQWDPPKEPNGQVTSLCIPPVARVLRVGSSYNGIMDSVCRGVDMKRCGQGYKVYYTTSPTLQTTAWHTQTVDTNQLTTISDLTPHTIYTIRIQAFTSRGPGPLSAPVQVKTQQGVPSQPTNLRVVATSSTTVQVSWTQPSHSGEKVVGYEVYWNDTFTQQQYSHPVEEAQTSHLLENLYPDTLYFVWVSAKSRAGEGAATPPVSVRTEQYVPGAPPQDVKGQAIDSRTLRISWQPPPRALHHGAIAYYKVKYARGGDEEVTTVRVEDPSQHFIILGDLQKWTSYSVWVIAGTTVGDGPPSPPFHVRTDEDVPGEPHQVKVTPINSTTILVQWQPPADRDRNGLIRGYQIHVQETTRIGDLVNEPRRYDVASEKAQEYNVTGLQPDTDYAVQVAAVTRRGDGTRSRVKTARTLGGEVCPVPTRPEMKVQLTGEEPQVTVNIAWSRPSHTYGQLLSYRLRYGRVVAGGEEANLQEVEINPLDHHTTIPNLDRGGTLRVPPLWPQRRGWGQEVVNYLDTPEGERITRAAGMCSSLDENMEYVFRVRAYTVRGGGPWSTRLAVETPGDVPPAPTNVQAMATSDQSVEVWWDEVPYFHDILGYQVLYTQTPEEDLDSWKVKQVPLTWSAELEGLESHSMYAVRVAAILSNQGLGRLSDLITVKVTPTDVPTQLRAQAVTTHSMILSWRRPSKLDPLKYKEMLTNVQPAINRIVHIKYYSSLLVCRSPTGPTKSSTTARGALQRLPLPPVEVFVDSERTEYSIDSLFPFTSYQVNITAVPPDESPRPAAKMIVTTAMAAPKPMVKPDSFGVQPGNQISVILPKASEEYGPISHYFLAVVPEEIFTKDPDHYQLEELTETPLEQVGPYIAAKFQRRAMPDSFPLGDGNTYMGFVNRRLLPDQKYRIFVRAVVDTPQKRKQGEGNPWSSKVSCLFVMMMRAFMGLEKSWVVKESVVRVVTELAAHIDRLKANDNLKFSQEYESRILWVQSIDPGQQFTWENSNLEINKTKNRYANVIAYDHSRVVLQSVDGISGSDYINANYCDGYRRSNAYIATQGPLPETFTDFWRMVWEQNSRTIVMMTKLEERTRIKCDQYWPARGSENYGPVQVALQDTQDLATYCIRTFNIQKEKRGNVVVMGSAGVGRTGCFVVIDSMLERLKHETTVDIYGHVTCLRAQRNYMVQTEDQYLFIHEAVLEAVMAGSTEVPAGSLFTHLQMLRNTVPGEGCSGLSLEFKKLALMKTEPQKFVSANLPVNKPKNRLMNILPYESTRVCLQPIRNLEGSDYINASFIDGYRCRNAYIATQSPLPETTEEMWRMLWEHNSNLVVMLAEGTQYWPSERSHRYLYFVVEPITEYNMPQYILREFKVTDARSGLLILNVLLCQRMASPAPSDSSTSRTGRNRESPKSGEGFIEFIGQVHKTKEQFGQEGPITVHCSAGAGRTGVFITLSIVLERMQYEGVVDLFQTVRTLRTQRPGMVQTELTTAVLTAPKPMVKPDSFGVQPGNQISVILPKASEEYGPISHYFLAVVPEEIFTKDPDHYQLEELTETPLEQVGPYIAAKFQRRAMPDSFPLGDGNTYMGFVNRRLLPDQKYRIFVRAVVDTPQKRKQGEGNPWSSKVSCLFVMMMRAFMGLEKILGCQRICGSSSYRVITELAAHIDRLKANDNLKFSQEYESRILWVQSIDPGQQFTWENSNLEINKTKNRYANVIAYDHSRVVLQSVDGISGSDYINANYCDGYRRSNAYIATQGPLPETFTDFWRMVWEQNSRTIVMMTKLEERTRIKCDQYWPARGSENYGPVQVALQDTQDLATYCIRTFNIQKEKQGNVVVMGSAGVGRTGCFVVIDSMLERLKHETTVDIYGHVTCLRAQRNYMVQTEDQYLFIHEAVLEAVMAGSTEVPAGSLFTHLQMLRNTVPGEGCSGLSLEFKKLALMKTEPQKFVSANLPVNKPKNRLMNILPYESTRVCLQPIRNLEGSDYINASFIDGYRCRNAYIATQSPLPETTEEMWRMLWEHNSNLVVMLAEGTQYWPSERSHRYLYFVVEPITEYNMPQYILREFKVTDARDGQSRTIRQFHFTDWPEQGVPKSGEGFIEFIGQVHKTKEQFGQEGPITVHCSAGAGRTGVFITLSIVLERMQYEGVVDLFQTVRTLRTQRPGMVQTEEQYHFCYQAALEYLNSFDHYAN
ncbi:PTPRD [Cordylochernes scorpioides]|uniref:protein-tyrosine-phosphatase n=1 Tax=Cordylochernes scorpioides TaxID=51811 RepID=A0ABY6KWR5_9ARAC|nr:PTPRD [Cordylochernes scorpioides]